MVRPPRSEDSRRHHRPGRGVPHRRVADSATPKRRWARASSGLAWARVRKPVEPAYRRFETYDIVDPGKWTVNKGKDRIEFVHELGDTAGYAYTYRKTVRLLEGFARARASAEEHRPQGDRDQRLQPQLLHDGPSANRPRYRGAISVRAARDAAAERSGRDPRQRREVPARVRQGADRLYRGRRVSARRRRTTTSGSRTARPARACGSPGIGRCRKSISGPRT